jgi:hypothetical protein
MWEFKNPFQWIIDIPTYDEFARVLLLFYYLAYMLFTTKIVSVLLESDEKLTSDYITQNS